MCLYLTRLIVYLAEIGATLTLLCILLICQWQALRRYCNSVDRSARYQLGGKGVSHCVSLFDSRMTLGEET